MPLLGGSEAARGTTNVPCSSSGSSTCGAGGGSVGSSSGSGGSTGCSSGSGGDCGLGRVVAQLAVLTQQLGDVSSFVSVGDNQGDKLPAAVAGTATNPTTTTTTAPPASAPSVVVVQGACASTATETTEPVAVQRHTITAGAAAAAARRNATRDAIQPLPLKLAVVSAMVSFT